jgi:hypothetical protein
MAFVICSVSFSSTIWAQEQRGQPVDVKLLQAKIRELEKTIESQQKLIDQLKNQLGEQIEENKRLLALCKEAGIQTAIPAKTSFKPGEIVYRGEKRTQKWFDTMYEKFRDKIVYTNGKYIDIGETLLNYDTIESHHMTWPIGTPVRLPYTTIVVSVIGKGEILITNRNETVVAHIHGLEGTFVDGQEFPPNSALFIYTGTFRYTTAMGAQKTVPSLAVYKPVTKEQFAEAMNSGFELVEYKRVPRDKRGRTYEEGHEKGYQTDIDSEGTITIRRGNQIVKQLKREEYNYEIIKKPIP